MSAMPGMLVGVRHGKHADCKCGCSQVVGIAGYIVQDDDTPKLAAMDPPMAIYAFDVPELAMGDGVTREALIAYEATDLQDAA